MKLAIYCAGGLGKEIYDLALRNNDGKWEEIFFVDDLKTESTYCGAKLHKFDVVCENKNNIEFLIATGEPFVREILFRKIAGNGFKVAKLIDKTAVVSPSAFVDDGTIISYNSFVSSDVKIGKNNFIQPHMILAHDSIIGENCVLSSFCQISGNCSIGDAVYLGLNSIVREKVSIGSGCIIGMGSCIHKNIKELSVAYGNPAKVIRKNETKRVFTVV